MTASGKARFARPSLSALGIVVVLLLPYVVLGDTDLVKVNEIAAFVILGIALNIAAGFAGQFILGLGGVFAVGGYAAAYAVNRHPSWGFLGMIVAGVVIATLAGIIVGLPTLRVGGFYLGIVTLFAAVIVPNVAQHTSWLGGATGIPLFANPLYAAQLGVQDQYLTFAGIILVMTLLSWAILHSRLGRQFQLIAASEELSASLGVSAYRTKMTAVVIASAIAGLGGAVYVYGQQFFSPDSASVNLSVLALAAVVVGGLGKVSGPIIGCALIFGMNTFLSFQAYTGVVFGGLLLVFVLFARRGVAHGLAQLADRLGVPRQGRQDVDPLPAAEPDQTAIDPAALPELRIAGARRAFGGVQAVDDVSMSIRRAELHGLVGSNGSGKTTLLNLISGFYRLDSGTISLTDGADLTRQPAYRRAGSRIARTFQTPKLLEHSTVFENVLVGAEVAVPTWNVAAVFRLPWGRRALREAEARAGAALTSLNLRGVGSVEVAALPHGTRRLVEVARTLATDPAYVLVDEPGAGLSEAEMTVLAGSLVGMTEQGIGVLLIEHNVPLVLSMAARVTALHQGKPLFQGTPAGLRADPQVATAFLGSSAAHDEGVVAHELS